MFILCITDKTLTFSISFSNHNDLEKKLLVGIPCSLEDSKWKFSEIPTQTL